MNAALDKENTRSPLDRCTVVAIYDDPFTRARALAVCDYLVSQLWENVELDFHWWRTDFLGESNMAQAAAHYAAGADFLIVCSTGTDAPSSTLEAWFESWIRKRRKTEGVLIDLSLMPTDTNRSTRLQRVLQDIAERGSFDYLTTVPTHSVERHRNLPSTRTPQTGRMIEHSRPPSRFGLNE
jgi:hypothetical protein